MAVGAHAGQVRKGTEIPYVTHPIHVAFLLAGHGFDEDLVIAGLLHDTVEDAGLALGEIEAQFGERVASLVRALTKPDLGHGPRHSWRAGREAMVRVIRESGPDVAAIKAADSLHNASATLADLRTHGSALWERFNAPAADIVWYYGQVQQACAAHLPDHPLVKQLDQVVRELAHTARVEGYL
jgi:(p)ppGpp synthase/HD superfamily hydrolase